MLDDTIYRPTTIATLIEITSALNAIDDGQFESLITLAVRRVLEEEVVGQILDGAGSTSHELQGLWGEVLAANQVAYGATDADFGRDDVLTFLNNVLLSKADGSMPLVVASTGFWKVAQNTARRLAGTTSAGLAAVETFILDEIMYTPYTMGMMEGVPVCHFAGLSPSGVTNGALCFKADRVVLWFWGDSLFLRYVPTSAAKDTWKMTAECGYGIVQPDHNLSRINQT